MGTTGSRPRLAWNAKNWGLETAELTTPTVGAVTFRGVPVLHMALSQACTDQRSSETGREECGVACGEEQGEGQR